MYSDAERLAALHDEYRLLYHQARAEIEDRAAAARFCSNCALFFLITTIASWAAIAWLVT